MLLMVKLMLNVCVYVLEIMCGMFGKSVFVDVWMKGGFNLWLCVDVV